MQGDPCRASRAGALPQPRRTRRKAHCAPFPTHAALAFAMAATDPGLVLTELHQRILRRDPELEVRLASRQPDRMPPPDTLPPEARPLENETFVFTQFSGRPQVFLTADELVAELDAGFDPDPSVPITEYNRRLPGMLPSGGPVIYEAAFRRRT